MKLVHTRLRVGPASAFDDTDGSELGYAVAYGCLVEDVHDLDYVLVGVGLFLVEAVAAAGLGDHTAVEQLLSDGSAFAGTDRGPTRHPTTRTVARAAEGVLHGPRLTDQHVARSTHVPGHEHRLTDRLVPFG